MLLLCYHSKCYYCVENVIMKIDSTEFHFLENYFFVFQEEILCFSQNKIFHLRHNVSQKSLQKIKLREIMECNRMKSVNGDIEKRLTNLENFINIKLFSRINLQMANYHQRQFENHANQQFARDDWMENDNFSKNGTHFGNFL